MLRIYLNFCLAAGLAFLINFSAVAQTFPGASPWFFVNPTPIGSALTVGQVVGNFCLAAGPRAVFAQNQSGNWNRNYNIPNIDATDLTAPQEATVYASGTGPEAGVHKSTNGGFIWRKVFPTDGSNRDVFGVAFPRFSLGIILLENGAVMRTLNEGATWEMAASPGTGRTLFVKEGLGLTVFAGKESGGLWRTTDSAQTWTQVSGIPASETVTCFAANASNGRHVAGCRSGAVYTSTDGVSWQGGQVVPASVVDVEFSSANTIMAVSPNLIYRSSFNNLSWTQVQTAGVTNISDLTVMADNSLYAFSADNGNIISAISDASPFQLVNRGVRKTFTSGLIRTNLVNQFLLSTDDGSVFTGIGALGQTFDITETVVSQGNRINRISKSVLPLQPMLVGDNGHLYTSTSAGQVNSWTRVTLPTTNHLRGASGNQIFRLVAGDNGTIFRSINNGSTWTSVTSQASLNWTDVLVTDNNTGLIAGPNGTLLRTTNFGANFTSSIIGNSTITSLHGVQGGTVWAGFADGRVRISGNNGAAWSDLLTMPATVIDMTGTRTNDIQVLCTDGFVYHIQGSTITGRDRISTTQSLTGMVYMEQSGLPAIGGNIVFGVGGSILSYSYPITTSITGKVNNIKPLQIIGNPVKEKLVFGLSESQTIKSLHVIDYSGRIVLEQLPTQRIDAATYEVSLNALPKGTYRLLVNTEDFTFQGGFIKSE